jgi:hypothetical protein
MDASDILVEVAETVLLVGVNFENWCTSSCVVELSDVEDPVEVFMREQDFSIEDIDELLIVRDGFRVEQVVVEEGDIGKI